MHQNDSCPLVGPTLRSLGRFSEVTVIARGCFVISQFKYLKLFCVFLFLLDATVGDDVMYQRLYHMQRCVSSSFFFFFWLN